MYNQGAKCIVNLEVKDVEYKMKLHDLIKCLHNFPVTPKENPTITNVTSDTRKVKEGSLFICIKGYRIDGHDLVKEAASKGAVAVVAERPVDSDIPVVLVRDTNRAQSLLASTFYHHPSQQLQVIGITGTNGKTTTSHIIEQMLARHGEKTGIIGTIGVKIGDTYHETSNTTPDAVTLQNIFATMVKEELDSVVMEVSSHALDLGRVHHCDFNVAVFTNLTQDHLDYHGTLLEYQYAKELLFSQLGSVDSQGKPTYAVLNWDDAVSKTYYKHTQATVITYGIKEQSDVMATDISIGHKGTTFTLKTPIGEKTLTTKLIGQFNIYNLLASAASAMVCGVPFSTIVEAIEGMEGVPGRFELVDAGQDFTVIVDYAHTPDSLENVLKTIESFAKGKVYCIVGCGGDRDKTKRPLMAEIAVTYSDVPIFTSDNPRSESPESILDDMVANLTKEQYTRIEKREEAILAAVKSAKENDIVLIAGKGHETYQIIGKEVFDFDDRQVAAEYIQKRLKN